MKAHVMNGQIKALRDSKQEYAWLSKEELKELVEPEYFEAIKDMM